MDGDRRGAVRADRPCHRRAANVGRRHSGAQGFADELSSRRRGRRRLAGRDRHRARARFVLVDQYSPAIAGAAWAAGTELPPSQAHSRRDRPEASEINQCHGFARTARSRSKAVRHQAYGRARAMTWATTWAMNWAVI